MARRVEPTPIWVPTVNGLPSGRTASDDRASAKRHAAGQALALYVPSALVARARREARRKALAWAAGRILKVARGCNSFGTRHFCEDFGCGTLEELSDEVRKGR